MRLGERHYEEERSVDLAAEMQVWFDHFLI
jgi:hypothetical protein